MSTQPDYKHSYDEDTCDDEGNNTGKLTVYCVNGKLCYDWDRGPDGEVEPMWFLIINTDDPVACGICSGEVKEGYEPPKKVKVVMPYEVATTIQKLVNSTAAAGWMHDNENACERDPDAAERCSVCLLEEWLEKTLGPAMKPVKMKKGGRAR